MSERGSQRFRNQQGQASILVLALIGVVLLSLIFLYQSGKITSEKMQLQNAADAAAYGAATLEARHLNFCAYTNRAMVANEVAVGQLVGLVSLSSEIESFGEYLQVYAEAVEIATAWLYAIVTVGDVIAGIIDVILELMVGAGEVIEGVGEALNKAIEAISSVLIGLLSANNEVLSLSQPAYRMATMALVTTNLFKSVENNTYGSSFKPADLFSRDRSGAQVSDLGLIALAVNLATYDMYTKRYSALVTPDEDKDEEEEDGDDGEDKKDKDKKKEPDDGIGRLAATVRAARDPFSSGGPPIHAQNIYGMDVEYKNRDWFLGLEIEEHFKHKILGVKLDILLQESIGARSKGGSEIRKKGEGFVWSGLDTLLGGPGFAFDVSVKFPKPLDFMNIHKRGSVEAGLPMGGGIAQAGSAIGEDGGGGSQLTILDFVNPVMLADFYNEPFMPYGGAGAFERFLMVDVAATEHLEDNSMETYQSLHPYRDRTVADAKEDPADPPFLAAKTPFFLVGVTRKTTDITDKGPQFIGRLDLINDTNNTIQPQITTVAKSQVYFARPTDLSYFRRLDNREEKSNVFSPFWQARLVNTTNTDRLLALALQDHVIWVGDIHNDMPGWVESIISFLQTLTDIFR